jgi:DNA-binding winged helix-turn-helix (wHTH) protein/TolB-like protein/Tfp pilus assembly protein PilF
VKTSHAATERVFLFGEFRLEADARRLLKAGQLVPLTPKVFDTLLYLVEHRGTVLTKDELLSALWPDVTVEENNLGQAISKLRQVLGESPGDNRFIVTIQGRGYRFAAEVTSLPREAEYADHVAEDHSHVPRFPADGLPAGLPARHAVWSAVALIAVGLIVYAAWSLREAGSPDSPSVRTLAVLPFKPLVAGNDDEALEFGMADSLIGRLGHIRQLTVRPLAAVRRFHHAGQDPFAAGRELDVEAVLDGHIHRTEDRIRITVRLLRMADERQIWAGQYDEPLTSIFRIQDTISERLARELSIQLSPAESQRVAQAPTGSPAAYEHYLRGRFFISLAQPRNAIQMFEQAVRLDPAFAPAHAGLADTLSRVPIATDGPSHETMRLAKAAALTAQRLDGDLGEAYAALGWISFYYEWDWSASEAHFVHALALAPDDFSARLGYAHLLSNTRRPEEAMAEVGRALAADPLSPLAGTLRGQFLFHAGRQDEARTQLQRTIAASPGFWIAQSLLGRMDLEAGRSDDAMAAFDKAAAGGGVWTPLALRGYGHAVSGQREQALRILRDLQDSGTPAAPPYLIALVHLGLNDRPHALAWLERAYAEKDVRMVFLGVDPVWEPLREEPRFVRLLARMRMTR